MFVEKLDDNTNHTENVKINLGAKHNITMIGLHLCDQQELVFTGVHGRGKINQFSIQQGGKDAAHGPNIRAVVRIRILQQHFGGFVEQAARDGLRLL